jgi:hypothetical protein
LRSLILPDGDADSDTDGNTLELVHAEETQTPQEPWRIPQNSSDMEELGTRFVLVSHNCSPAPFFFAVCFKSERIALWNPGMAAAAPMVVGPVSSRLSNLPFVDTRDVPRLCRFLGRIVDAPDEHNPTHVTNNKRILLLEVVATLIRGTNSELLVVLTGRSTLT